MNCVLRLEVIEADFHIHSNVSDGILDPREIVVKAMTKKLSAISVTDHNSFRGSIIAYRFVKEKKLPIIIVFGCEVRTREGDVLLLCSSIPHNPVPTSVPKLLKYADENSCIAIVAHPFDILRHGVGTKILKYNWHAIEAFNASTPPMINYLAYKWSIKRKIPIVACSDAHVPEFIGSYRTLIPAEYGDSVDDILKAIRRGLVGISLGRIRFSSRVKHFSWSIRRRIR